MEWCLQIYTLSSAGKSASHVCFPVYILQGSNKFPTVPTVIIVAIAIKEFHLIPYSSLCCLYIIASQVNSFVIMKVESTIKKLKLQASSEAVHVK